MNAEEQQKAYERHMRQEQQQETRSSRDSGASATRHATRDTRLMIEVESLPTSPNPGQRTRSFFKPHHLKSAFTNDVSTVYCLPGGPLGVEMVDSQIQPPVEKVILEKELHFMRDKVHRDKVLAQKAARQSVQE